MNQRKYIYIPFYLLVIGALVVLSSCQRENTYEEPIEWEQPNPPPVVLDTSVNLVSNLTLSHELAETEIKYVDGSVIVEEIDDQYFVQIVVRENNNSGLDPFLFAWKMDELAPGIGAGEIASFVIKDEDGNNTYLNSGPFYGNGTTFTVDVQEIGDLGESVKGFFSGTGINESTGEKIEFDGSFNAPRRSMICDYNVIIDKNIFDIIESDPIYITDAFVEGECMTVDFQRSGGCRNLVVYPVDSGEVVGEEPPVRYMRLIDASDDPCEALPQEHISINVFDLQVEGHKKVKIELEGWPEVLYYEY